MLKIYAMEIAELRTEECWNRCLSLLEENRINKIRSLKMRDDRLRSAAAGLLLRHALLEENIMYSGNSFSEESNGKPVLVDGILQFSLSHSGEAAVCAVSDCRVGVDIERPDRFEGRENRTYAIADRILTNEEKRKLYSGKTGQELIRMWTRKEAYAKMTGKGLGCVFSELDTLHSGFYQEHGWKEYWITVCTEQACDNAEWKEYILEDEYAR